MENNKNKFGIGEQYIREVYDNQIREMPTFSEEMQKNIEEELKRVIDEYNEYFKKQEEEKLNKIK